MAGDEPLAKKSIAVRLPESLDAQVRQIAGNDLVRVVEESDRC
jgi:hypothetical protein